MQSPANELRAVHVAADFAILAVILLISVVVILKFAHTFAKFAWAIVDVLSKLYQAAFGLFIAVVFFVCAYFYLTSPEQRTAVSKHVDRITPVTSAFVNSALTANTTELVRHAQRVAKLVLGD